LEVVLKTSKPLLGSAIVVTSLSSSNAILGARNPLVLSDISKAAELCGGYVLIPTCEYKELKLPRSNKKVMILFIFSKNWFN